VETQGQPTTSQQNSFATKAISDEFASWPANDAQIEAITEVKWAFDALQAKILNRIPPQNGRYAALVKTKLEEACMMAVKGITKP
jgi:hypothetical protein